MSGKDELKENEKIQVICGKAPVMQHSTSRPLPTSYVQAGTTSRYVKRLTVIQ
jgi:hypothetical protein